MKTLTETNNGNSTHKVNALNGVYEITLYAKNNHTHPHGYDMERIGSGSYYLDGGLEIAVNRDNIPMVNGYDGTYCLPLPVAILLVSRGYGFAPFIFPAETI